MEVTTHQLIEMLRGGTAPPRARAAIAKNALPLPPPVLIEALDIIADDPDEGTAAQALRTLADLPLTIVRGVASAPTVSPELLDRVAHRFASQECVVLDVARNPAATDRTIAFVATLPFPGTLEIVGRNQQRLERAPEIVLRLLANKHTPPTVVQLWREHEQRKAAPPPPAAPAAPPPPLEVEEEPIPAEARALLIEEEEAAGPEAAGATARQLSVYQLLKTLSMGQKVALATKGNREVRNILIHESNKMLCLKVLENPRLGESDIEAWAKATNVADDVLRGIANRKEWMKKYTIMRGLTFNPKAPLGITLDLVKRLTKKDLEQLTRNRNVPETLRNTARRLFVLKRDSNQ